MLTDLAILTDQVNRIQKITIVLIRDIQLGVSNTDQRVCTLGEEGVLSCQSLGHLAKLRIQRARKLGEEECHLTEMTRRPGKSTTERIRDLDAKIDAINIGANALVTVNTLVR